MGARLDLTGQRFGRLIVFEKVGKDKHGQRFWKCQCDCGKTKIIRANSLKCGFSRSCGCLLSEISGKRFHQYNIKYNKFRNKARRLPKGEAGFNALFYSYQQVAKKRGHKFSLTQDKFRNLTKQSCFYCNQEPNQMFRKKNKHYTEETVKNGEYIYNGIDRIDNTKDYTADNCVACCKRCNWAKSNLTQQEFYNWVERVYKHFFGGRR